MTLSNIYKAGKCGSRKNIFSKDERKFVTTYFPTRRPWFVKFMRRSKLRMGVIRNPDFGIPALIMDALQKIRDIEWEVGEKSYRIKKVDITADVLIGFCRGLRGEAILLTSLTGMLQFW